MRYATSDIKDFHTRFGLEYNGKPRELDINLSSFRVKFMQEELHEYIEAVYNQDLEKQLDALVDLVYVVLGTAYLHGFNFAEAWDRVHAANMRKVKADLFNKDKRDFLYDVVKPPGWTPADLSDLVK